MTKPWIQETCLPQAGRVVARGDQECCGCVAKVHVLIRGDLPDKRSLDSALHGNMPSDQAEVSRGHSKCGYRHHWRNDDGKRAATRIYGGDRGGLTPLKGQTRRTVACPMSSEMH
jgi:hypothetical protein